MENIQSKLAKASERQTKKDKKEYPTNWIPVKAGENLFGEITEINSGFGKSEDLLFWTITEKGTGKEWSILESTTLSSAKVRLELKVGSIVGIQYNGTGTSKSGRTYKKFVVVKE